MYPVAFVMLKAPSIAALTIICSYREPDKLIANTSKGYSRSDLLYIYGIPCSHTLNLFAGTWANTLYNREMVKVKLRHRASTSKTHEELEFLGEVQGTKLVITKRRRVRKQPKHALNLLWVVPHVAHFALQLKPSLEITRGASVACIFFCRRLCML